MRAIALLALVACEVAVSALAPGVAGAATARWTRIQPVAPPTPRFSLPAVYDPANDRMIIATGWGEERAMNEVYALPLERDFAYEPLTPVGIAPAGRLEAAAVHVPERQSLLVFGGKDGIRYFGDAWELSLRGVPTWTELVPEGSGPNARETRAIYDPVGERVLFLCGYAPKTFYNDVWALRVGDSPRWTRLETVGDPPAARAAHSAAYDPVRHRVLIFGGQTRLDGAFENDLWSLDLAMTPARWSRIATPGPRPSPRYGCVMTYDSRRDRFVLFGGFGWEVSTPSKFLGDVWELTLGGTPRWNPIAVQPGPAPSPRDFPAAIADPKRDRMLVFGGNGPNAQNDELWELRYLEDGAPARRSPTRRVGVTR